MKLLKLVFLLLFLLLPIWLYSAESYRNPFEPLLPKEEAPAKVEKSKEVSAPLKIVVEGVLWGSLMPQAIIDGEVYKVGDKVKNLENVSVFRIIDNVVFIAEGDKIHKMTVGKRQ